MTRTHAESLLRIPIVSQMERDPGVAHATRAVDNSWYYDGHIQIPVTGFNPALGKIYSAKLSAYSKWAKRKNESARKYNFEDNLTYEVLFSAHDYLHIWAYQTIKAAIPEMGFGSAEITEENFEDFVYLHLLTEIVATIGLDYWYLSNIDLNSVAPIGTTRTTLATNYSKALLPEFQRFHPAFNPYSIDFFDVLENLYCYSTIKGFSGTALEKSPALLAWMKHEYKYAETQRRLTRLWLSSFKPKMNLGRDGEMDRPLKKTKSSWKNEISRDIRKLLWNKMVHQRDIFAPPTATASSWQASEHMDVLDFRFTNLNYFGDDFWQVAQTVFTPKEAESYLFNQIVSKYKLETIDPNDVDLIMKLKSPLDLDSLRTVLRNYSPIPVSRPEARSVFVAG